MNALPQDSKSRVEDYLNDKFQTVSDLENIDNLLAKVQEQQEVLRTQLEEARKSQKQVEVKYEKEKADLQRIAIKHENDQEDIAKRLQALTQSEVSDDALQNLQAPMQKLRRIDVAAHYVKTLQHAEQLEQNAYANLDASPEQAVKAHRSLQSLVLDIEDAQGPAEGAAPVLFDNLSSAAKTLYNSIKHSLEEKLVKALDSMGWPKKVLKLTDEVLEDWSKYARLLLELQEPFLLRDHPDILSQTPSDPVVLAPLAVMARPIAQRFRFNFYGDRQSNRLDKPNYYFDYFIEALEDHSGFMIDYLQPLLDERIRRDDRLDLVYTDAVSSFITALLPMLAAKCESTLPQLKAHPSLMSKSVWTMMSFDTALQQTWAYSPYPGPLGGWKGLTWDMLTKKGYFEAWLKLEKDFALTRYQEILDNPKSRNIEYDFERGYTKPTIGAILVNDVLKEITDRYRPLSSFSQKMRFLIDIQLSIFDQYRNYLREHLVAYRTSSHTTGRALTGQSANDAMGLQGLETISKIYSSSEYLEREMSDWSDDVFFLELWEELQDRASQNTGRQGTVGRGLSVAEVAAKTSTTIKNADEILESDGGALFDETAAAYHLLRDESEAEIVRLLQVNARNSIRSLQNVSIWASLSTTVSHASQLTPSSALDNFIQVMSPLFEYLAKVLAAVPLRKIVKQICMTIQEELYERLLMKHIFSAAGANQLKRDVAAITSTIDSSTGLPGEAQKHFTRLSDALSLLALPIKSSRAASTPGTQTGDDDDDDDDDGWGFDEEGNEEDHFASLTPDEGSWGLWQAEKAIFADNASARKALESMGLIHLSEIDARNIIKRRIEINS